MTVLTAFAALIVWVVWSLLYPYKVLTVNPGSWVVQNPGKRVARGEAVQLYVDYCTTRQDAPRMDVLIEQDGRAILFLPQYPASSIGCHKAVVSLVTIPKVIAIESTSAGGSGKAKLQIALRYRINALREIQYNFTSDEFIIDP